MEIKKRNTGLTGSSVHLGDMQQEANKTLRLSNRSTRKQRTKPINKPKETDQIWTTN